MKKGNSVIDNSLSHENEPHFDLLSNSRCKQEERVTKGKAVIENPFSHDNELHFDLPSNFRCRQKESTTLEPELSNAKKVNKNKLKCMYTNTDCLTNKLDELELFLQSEHVDIAAICETMPKSKPADEKLNFDIVSGFECLENQSGRGACLYIKNSLQYTRISEYEELFSPSVFCKVDLSKEESFLVGVVYRSPNSDDVENDKLMKQLNHVYSLCKKSGDKFVLLGDFNLPDIDWKEESSTKSIEHLSSRFLEYCMLDGMTQFVTHPTHHRTTQTPTLIDLILSNLPTLVHDVKYFPPLGMSHHSVLTCELDLMSPEVNQPSVLKFQVDKGDYAGMRVSFSNLDWDSLLKTDDDVDTWWDIISSIINDCVDKYVPKKRYRQNAFKRSFYAPDTLLERIRLKRRAFKYYKKFPTTENYKTYVRYRNQVKWETRKAKRAREAKVAKDAKLNPKAFFQYVASKTKLKEAISNLTQKDGTLTEDDEGKAKVLSDFFGSVFTKEDLSNVPEFSHPNVQNILSNVTIADTDVCNSLKSLKVCKSPGPDGIHPRVLKELANELAYPLKLLFEKTVNESKLPSAWKLQEIRPIFKKGNKNTPGNYRPVSLTSIVCKVFEGYIRDALYKHMVDNDLLSINQYGFCKGRSCVTQLLSTLFDWFQSLDRGIPVDAVYLDFRKAFDTVPHKRLLSKLHGYGVRGQVLGWVDDFLSDREQYVSVNEKCSERVPVTSGVPQGSVLGPILFIYFINDLPDVIKCISRIFADDTKAYQNIIDINDNLVLQESIDAMVEWGEKWMSYFNNEKCKVLHMGKNNPRHTYKMKDGSNINDLVITDCEKDLGVYIDSELSFDEHIKITINKAKNMCYLLMRTITYKSPSIMIPLYKSLIRPIIEYGNAAWAPYKFKDIDDLESIQRYYTKRIIGCSKLTYEERLQKLKLPSLAYRRMRGDLIEAYKITHNFYDPLTTKQFFNFYSDSNSSTRTNGFKIIKVHTNTTKFQHFFTNRVTNKWNSLPAHIVSADTINAFKNALDSHFVNIMYTIRVNYNRVDFSNS